MLKVNKNHKLIGFRFKYHYFLNPIRIKRKYNRNNVRSKENKRYWEY
jgi:hypothetical protein